MRIHHVLGALLCIQQVSGRVVARDDTSLAIVDDEIPGESCSLSTKRSNIASRATEDDNCYEVLNELSESDHGIDEADLEKLRAGDYTSIVCELMLLSVLAKFGNHVKASVGRHDRASTNDCVRAREIVLQNGRELAEVFWVRIERIDDENPGDLYGSITATDSHGKQVIYQKDWANADEIRPGQQVFLTGPQRPISATLGFDIDLNLADKDRDASPDDQVSYGRISWNPGHGHDFTRETRVTGQYGSATVNYVVMSRAAQAEIDVVLINGDDENPADIFGTIAASSKFGRRNLFTRAGSDYIQLAPGQKFPLNRATMAVSVDDELVFHVNVWDHDADASPNDQVAAGRVEITPQAGTSARRVVNGKFGQIEIRVTWS